MTLIKCQLKQFCLEVDAYYTWIFFVTSDWDNKIEKDSVIKMSRMISIIMSLIHFLSYTVCRFAFPDISCK